MRSAANPLVDDGFIGLVLHDLVDVQSLLSLPAYREHDRESIELYLNAIRRFSRERLFPTYRAMQNEPPELLPGGRVRTHEVMPALWNEMVELGLLTAARPESVGGQQLPTTVHALASTYLMAGNLSAIGFIWLTTGAAHLIEAFGPDRLRERFMRRMYAGEWSGTMALTEPHAGSSLGDVTTKATPTDAPDGHYLVKGSKIFISGGDHSVVENVVHLALARIEGAPAGSKGISLFAIPRLRESEGGALEPNDVRVSQVIHKIGWKGMPSVALEFGDDGDCRGWLVGEANQGLRHMFQMMNEARIMVGANGAATASAAYHEALRYARDRTQGRTIHDPKAEQPAPIIQHSDVRRMLLRQKSIVEGSIALVAVTGRYADEAEHAEGAEARAHAQLLLDLLTPVTKTLPAEKGFEANALAVQVHGGYGYTSEFLVESYMRDQKLNTIHEGTTGIQSMDLLGRKVMAKGGAALRAFGAEVQKALSAATEAGVEQRLIDEVRDALETTADLTMTLGKRGMERDMDGMLSHSVDYLELFGALVLGWVWLRLITIAEQKLVAGVAEAEAAKLEGVRCAGQYWIRTEVPRVATLAQLCRDAEDSYVRMRPEWFG